MLSLSVYADWCGPCKQIAPLYESLAKALSRPNVITFTKVDTEAQPELASTYSITALPTFLVFRDGKVANRVQGANAQELKSIIQQLQAEADNAGSGSGASGSGGAGGAGGWRGAELPRNYRDITDQIEIPRCELLNVDSDAGGVRVLFSGDRPSALGGGGGQGKVKDWVESDTDEQLMLFMPFQSMIKLHTLQVRCTRYTYHDIRCQGGAQKLTATLVQITSLPPQDGDDDETPMRPRHIKLYSNKPHNLGFDEAEDTAATQDIELSEEDWNKDGTASVALRFVKFQNINSLVVFVVSGDGDSEKVRIDRLRLIGDAGEKREMGKLEKIGDEPGE